MEPLESSQSVCDAFAWLSECRLHWEGHFAGKSKSFPVCVEVLYALQSIVSQYSRSEPSMLSLREAVENGRLQEFIAQEEARGVASIAGAEFENTASIVIKTPQPDDQTSGSLHPDGSPEK